jgi:uncharacterized membrane protein YraQ (UPF0718 family)
MNSKRTAGGGGMAGWAFLMVVLVVYAVTALIDSELVLRSLAVFTRLLDKVLPTLALVVVLIFAVDLLLHAKRVERYLGERSGAQGWLVAIVSGILSTGAVYAWYAVLHDLRKKGMRTSLVAAIAV